MVLKPVVVAATAGNGCDNPIGAATSYPLDPSGETVIDETASGSRFFRLKAE